MTHSPAWGAFLPLLLDPSRVGSSPGSQASTAEGSGASVGFSRHQGWVTLRGAPWASPAPTHSMAGAPPQSDGHRCPQMPPGVSWGQKNLLGENGCFTVVKTRQEGPCWVGGPPPLVGEDLGLGSCLGHGQWPRDPVGRRQPGEQMAAGSLTAGSGSPRALRPLPSHEFCKAGKRAGFPVAVRRGRPGQDSRCLPTWPWPPRPRATNWAVK